jgi:peptide chain release factor 2
MQKINQEKALLEKSLQDFKKLLSSVEDAEVMIEMVAESHDEALLSELKENMTEMNKIVQALEVKSLLSGELDGNNCFLSINSGAGGTEAQDWANMLYRMYERFCSSQGYKLEVLSIHQGEEAGIKSVTLSVQGPYAFGYLKAEAGVHRLVRISPFDSNARRHTSFASVTVWPEVDDDINVEVREEDIKVDTYRASGAGGQHINTTDSAIRITHTPTGIVVTCQNQRSQHANRDQAMKMLKAALYELELERIKKEKDEMIGEKKANEWGSQIRSYVLHPYQMVKDHRTNWETGSPSDVLDGDLQEAIESYLKFNVSGGSA